MATQRLILWTIFSWMTLSACGGGGGGGGGPYTVGGSVAGLLANTNVVLLNNGANSTTVSANGTFTFSLPVPAGMPYAVTVAMQPLGQNCSVANGSGSTNGANVSNVSVACAALPYKVGVTVTGLSNVSGLVLQNNGGDDLAINMSGKWSFSTAVAAESRYAVSISSQPSGHTCLVLNASGTITNASANVSVVCPWQLLYSANGAPSISAFYLDQTTGRLSAGVLGSPFKLTTGAVPSAIALTPSRQFAYAPDAAGNLSAFSVDSTTGALTAITGSPMSVGTNLSSIVIDPTGRFLYVMNYGSNTIPGFAIDSSTGAIKSLAGSPYSASSGAGSGYQKVLAMDPSGRFLYAAGAALLGYTIDSATGVLSPLPGSPFAFTGRSIEAMTVTPIGPFVICAGPSNLPLVSFVYVYSLNESTGALTSVGGGTQNGIYFTSVVVDSTGRFLYVGDNGIGSNNIEAFTINSSTGALSAIAGSPYPVNNPASLIVDPTVGNLYAGGGGIYQFTIDGSTGALTTIDGNQGSTSVGSTGLSLSLTP